MVAKPRNNRFTLCTLACLALVTSALLAVPPTACGCPFCSMQGQTLTGEVNQASLVLFGTLTNARLNLGAGGFEQGSTDLQIEAVIKKHEILGDKKIITLPRYLPTDKNTTKFLIFCDVFKGKIDPLRGIPVKSGSDIIKYLEGALAEQHEHRLDGGDDDGDDAEDDDH